MFTKPARCESCGKIYQARSRNTTCPHCEGAAAEPAAPWRLPSDNPVSNTLANTFASQPIKPITEVPCPNCAETIKAAAKECRFCFHVIGAPKARSSGRHRAADADEPRRRRRAVEVEAPRSDPTQKLLVILVIAVVVLMLAVVGFMKRQSERDTTVTWTVWTWR